MRLLRLQKHPPPGGREGSVIVYADPDGALKQVSSEGEVSDVGGPGGGSQTLNAYTITVADVLAADGTEASFATATADAASLRYEAVEPGIGGNIIAVLSDVQPSVGALTVTVDGTTITVHLETDGDSVVLSTFSEVVTAVNATPAAAALVTASQISGGATAYEVGDLYLGSGKSRLVLAALASGSVIWDATVFIPEEWDATSALTPKVGPVDGNGAPIFYDGDPDLETADDTNTSGVAITQSTPIFTPAQRIRLTEAGEISVDAQCEAGAVPSQGEMLLCVDVRTPA